MHVILQSAPQIWRVELTNQRALPQETSKSVSAPAWQSLVAPPLLI
ncbi:uncharacterized, partial [Tachysurus ichikawai]